MERVKLRLKLQISGKQVEHVTVVNTDIHVSTYSNQNNLTHKHICVKTIICNNSNIRRERVAPLWSVQSWVSRLLKLKYLNSIF